MVKHPNITSLRTLCLMLLFAASAFAFVARVDDVRAQCPKDTICLLEPTPGGVTQIGPGTDAFQLYLFGGSGTSLWEWAFGIGVAIAVLNCTIAGFQIVFSNGDSGKVENGKTRFLWATLGLALLFLAGVILHFINPAGFTT